TQPLRDPLDGDRGPRRLMGIGSRTLRGRRLAEGRKSRVGRCRPTPRESGAVAGAGLPAAPPAAAGRGAGRSAPGALLRIEGTAALVLRRACAPLTRNRCRGPPVPPPVAGLPWAGPAPRPCSPGRTAGSA